MSPFTVAKVMPSLVLASIFGLLSSISNMDAVESFALLVSGAMALVWEIPIAEIVKAKKTCKTKQKKILLRKRNAFLSLELVCNFGSF